MMTQENLSWHQSRLGRFTSSEMWKLFQTGKGGNMFGEVAITYIHQKAAELLTMDVKEEVSSFSINWGYQYEKEACKVFERLMGIEEGVYYGKENPIFFPFEGAAGGSPDWERRTTHKLFGEQITVAIGADFKCPYNSSVHLENLSFSNMHDLKTYRKEYYIQLQCNILFLDWTVGYFTSYDPRFIDDKLKIKIIPVHPAEGFKSKLNERLEAATELRNKIMDNLLNA